MLVHRLPPSLMTSTEVSIATGFRVFALARVTDWLRDVGRRDLSHDEKTSVVIAQFQGVDGLASLSHGEYLVKARLPRDHESLIWRVESKEVRVLSVLTTPIEYKKMSLDPTDTSLLIVLVLSGAAEVVTPRSRLRYDPGSLFQLLPGELFSIRTEGIFSAVTIRLHRVHINAQFQGYEPCRLHAAIEIARTVLVEHLVQPHRAPHDRHLLCELLTHVLRDDRLHSEHSIASVVRERVRQMVEISHTDPSFNVQSITSSLNISRRHLYRQFESSQRGVSEIIAERRLETARELMNDEPAATLDLIASRSGFGSTENLRRAFLKKFGTTPGQYRKSLPTTQR